MLQDTKNQYSFGVKGLHYELSDRGYSEVGIPVDLTQLQLEANFGFAYA